MLPRVEILEKVARYKAHLSRILYKTLHKLKALQTRRLGGSILEVSDAGFEPATSSL